jgi:RNA polymerase sigma factor (sigma-70 family)
MMMTGMTAEAGTLDAELVTRSREGNRDAFGQIVSRYQSLICSLAYSATGCLGQSEDLAQETFITAWKHLRHLREPVKLRAWLCGIARNRINNSLRREGREPVHAAEPLEAVSESPSTQLLPSEQAISKEEAAILWRSIEHIPAIYREPLVLFYREGESVERVASALDISEDAVKQRLSRGRKMLQDQVLALVAGTLQRTAPGKAFTLGVIAVLPLLATTAKAATVTATATKGSSVAKAASGAGTLSAFLSAGMMVLCALFGLFGFCGRWIGRKMGRASQQSALGRLRIIQFWRTLAVGFLVFVLPSLVVPHSLIHSYPWVFRAETWSLAAFYWLVAAALAIWAWQRRRDARMGEAQAPEAIPNKTRSYNIWVTLGMTGPGLIIGMFLFALFFSDWTLSSRRIPETEARQIISERKDARFTVDQNRDGSRALEITLPENHRVHLWTPLNNSLVAALTEKGVAYPILIEDRDFHNGGVRGWLVLLSTFIVVAGAVLLLRRPGTRKFHQQEVATPKAERREKNFLAVIGALAMIAISLLFILFTIKHTSQTISGAEVRRIISEQKNARFELVQYANASKELWITLPGNRTYPGFTAPFDESVLALLIESKIPYKTYVQGRDFGFRGPGRWLSLSCSFILTASAAIVLWWVVKKNRLSAPAGSAPHF